MNVVTLEIKDKYAGRTFTLTLNLTSWWGFEGNWSAPAGYFVKTNGYFRLNTGYPQLYFYDREDSFTEHVSYVLGGDPSNVLMLCLKEFTSDVTVGNKGSGMVFNLGADSMRKAGVTEQYGRVSGDVTWKITNAY